MARCRCLIRFVWRYACRYAADAAYATSIRYASITPLDAAAAPLIDAAFAADAFSPPRVFDGFCRFTMPPLLRRAAAIIAY